MKKLIFFLLILIVLILYPFELSAAEKEYYIKVSLSKCRLWLYGLDNGSPDRKKLEREYVVATGKRGIPLPLGSGVITRIEMDPWWYPTAYTRWYFANRKGINLPSAVPPGHRLNYMGAFKIFLSHSTWKGRVYRIHGNNDPKQIGKRVTGGCIRMHNDEGVLLAKALKPGTRVDIEH